VSVRDSLRLHRLDGCGDNDLSSQAATVMSLSRIITGTALHRDSSRQHTPVAWPALNDISCIRLEKRRQSKIWANSILFGRSHPVNSMHRQAALAGDTSVVVSASRRFQILDTDTGFVYPEVYRRPLFKDMCSREPVELHFSVFGGRGVVVSVSDLGSKGPGFDLRAVPKSECIFVNIYHY